MRVVIETVVVAALLLAVAYGYRDQRRLESEVAALRQQIADLAAKEEADADALAVRIGRMAREVPQAGSPSRAGGTRTHTAVRAADTPVAVRGDPAPADDEPSDRFLQAQKRDLDRFGPSELQRIEDLYAQGTRGIDTEEGRQALARLVEQYPESNRAGCAANTLAQVMHMDGDDEGAQRYADFLLQSSNPSVYRNGIPARADAMLLSGDLAAGRGDREAAKAAWQRVMTEYPDETDLEGQAFAKRAGNSVKGLESIEAGEAAEKP